MDIPAGTVTFLFTDIEGSTKLWEIRPEAMRLALARHDKLLQQAIKSNNGFVFKTIGDAFCASFATAADALNAALDAQLALGAELPKDGLSLRVRMALNTGAVEHRDNDYFGQPLTRVARLLSAGHGGQVLLSQATRELTRDSLPARASLQPLGEHRLRDLARPEQVFQLLHPDFPSEFPPLCSLDNTQFPNNLPTQLTSFIGRDKEIAAVKALLINSRLLTLTGCGGSGKTRLSLQVAAETLEDFPDGVWLIELAPLTEAALMLQTIAQVLAFKEQSDRPLEQTLIEGLKRKRMLLLLDNCEHLLAASVQLAAMLLRSCPNVKLLVTSRQAFGIAGEQTYRVPSLSLPDPNNSSTIAAIAQYEAVHLFIERARLVKSEFTDTQANAPVLAQLCCRLDGIPLAIELAAARVRSMSVEDINNKLKHRFRLLIGGDRAALPRQQTLRALIDWSYDLLNEREKFLFERLSVFAGGWMLGAAGAVCSRQSPNGECIEEWEMLDLLTSLADKSLIVVEQEQGGTRYRLLETVRQYSRDRLEERGEFEIVRSRHLAFFLALAEEAEQQFLEPEQATWLERLEREHDNLRAALEWGEQPVRVRLAGSMWWFWYVRGYYSEGRKRLADVLAGDEVQVRNAARAKALNAGGVLACSQGDYAAASTLHEEALAIQWELGNRKGVASTLNGMGSVAKDKGDYAAAHALYEESLGLQHELGDTAGVATSLNNLGIIAYVQGDYPAARLRYVESLSLQRELGNKRGIAYSLLNLGLVASHQEDIAGAVTQIAESLALFREMGNKEGIAYTLNSIGNVLSFQGDWDAARACLNESLTLWREMGDKRRIALSLETFAALAYMQKLSARGARLWGAAEALREVVGAPMTPSDRTLYDQQVAKARASLSENVFAADWGEGRAMTMEQAIALALEENSA